MSESSDEKDETETPGKTDEELRQIAVDIYDGKIFTSQHLSESEQNLMPMVFMPLALMDRETFKSLSEVGMVYEYLDKAGPRSVNGCPSFFSMHTLTSDETVKVNDFFESYGSMKQQFMGKHEKSKPV